MANVIVILILIVLIGTACMYLCKKKGGACTGCPYSQSCVGGNCEKSSKNNKE